MALFSFLKKQKSQKPFDDELKEVMLQPTSTELPPQAKKTWKKLALILPGGGARGAIQVGGMKALWRHGVIPDVIIGLSVGATNGAVVASGRTPEELEHVWLKLSKKIMFPTNFRIYWELFHVKSLARTINFKKILKYAIKTDYLEECKIPCYIISTRLSDGELAYFNKGPIREAVLASMAMPPHYPPCLIDNIKYVDGGISGINGIKKAVELGCDAIIILNCYNTAKRYNFRGILDVTSHSLDLMFQKTMLHEIDVCATPFENTKVMMVKVPDMNVDTIDFSKTAELIRLGEEKTRDMLIQNGFIEG